MPSDSTLPDSSGPPSSESFTLGAAGGLHELAHRRDWLSARDDDYSIPLLAQDFISMRALAIHRTRKLARPYVNLVDQEPWMRSKARALMP